MRLQIKSQSKAAKKCKNDVANVHVVTQKN